MKIGMVACRVRALFTILTGCSFLIFGFPFALTSMAGIKQAPVTNWILCFFLGVAFFAFGVGMWWKSYDLSEWILDRLQIVSEEKEEATTDRRGKQVISLKSFLYGLVGLFVMFEAMEHLMLGCTNFVRMYVLQPDLFAVRYTSVEAIFGFLPTLLLLGIGMMLLLYGNRLSHILSNRFNT